MYNETLLKALESHQSVAVQFRTKAGKVRTMDCTRHIGSIPEPQRQGINLAKLNGPDIVCVYDNLIKDWRAFRWDSVITYDRANKGD